MQDDALYIRSIARAFRVLEAFSTEQSKMTLTELTKETGLSKSTVQRLIYTLEKEGYLIKDEKDKTYRLSMRFFHFGSIALRDAQVVDVAKPYMKKLRDQCGESTFLNIIFEGQRMCVEFLPGVHELQALVFVGQRSALYAGASAKALLAFLPDEEIDHVLRTESLQKMTANTLTSRKEIWREVRQIRRQGYALSNQERVEGAFSISFPIFNMDKKVVASLSITIPTVRVKEGDLPRYIQALEETARQISYEMGYRGAHLDAGLTYNG